MEITREQNWIRLGETDGYLRTNSEHHSGYPRSGQQKRQAMIPPASGIGQEYLVLHMLQVVKTQI